MVEIRKKSVLITGAGKRIGRAIALDLASQGWGVAVHYFTSKDDADEVVAEITRQGDRAVAVQANLGVEAELSVRPVDWLSLFANGAYIDAKIDDEEGFASTFAGARFRLQPKWQAAAGTRLEVSASTPRLAWTATARPPWRVISVTTSSASSFDVK